MIGLNGTEALAIRKVSVRAGNFPSFVVIPQTSESHPAIRSIRCNRRL